MFADNNYPSLKVARVFFSYPPAFFFFFFFLRVSALSPRAGVQWRSLGLQALASRVLRHSPASFPQAAGTTGARHYARQFYAETGFQIVWLVDCLDLVDPPTLASQSAGITGSEPTALPWWPFLISSPQTHDMAEILWLLVLNRGSLSLPVSKNHSSCKGPRGK